jgi:hypothetical protein
VASIGPHFLHNLLGRTYWSLLLTPRRSQWRIAQGLSRAPFGIPPFPPKCSDHLDCLAVVHLYHMEPEAVDSSDRCYEGT